MLASPYVAGDIATGSGTIERVSIVELQDWAAVIAIISGMVTMVGGFTAVLVTFNRKIDALDAKFGAKIDALDTKFSTKIDALNAKLENKVDTKIDGLRTEMVERFDEVNSRLQVLEQRTYDIGSRLPAVNG